MVADVYDPVSGVSHVEVVTRVTEPGKVIGEAFYELIQLLKETKQVSEILRCEAWGTIDKRPAALSNIKDMKYVHDNTNSLTIAVIKTGLQVVVMCLDDHQR